MSHNILTMKYIRLLLSRYTVIQSAMDNSPIRSIRNSNYAFKANPSQQYEQQFWKLKAQRAEASAQQLKKQNQLLNKKVIEKSRIEQDLREKVAVNSDEWKTISRKMNTERGDKYVPGHNDEKNNASAEIQRLIRQIRILKNLHEAETTKLNDENKTFRKQLTELQSLRQIRRQNDQNLKIISKLNDEISLLRRRLSSHEQQTSKLRQQKSRVISDCDSLRKQLHEHKLKQKLSLKQQQQKLLNYKQYCLDQNKLQLSRKDVATTPLRNDKHYGQISEQEQFEITLNDASFGEEGELTLLRQQIASLQKKERSNENKLQLEMENHKNYQLSSQLANKKLEADLAVARGELNNVLTRLAPLLSGRDSLSVNKENVNVRSSLSILELFLQKYKIQAF